ncbi:VOC family protein [Candidatus Parcubacteria bacterium]|nr:VOC family protein [Candidatus Parcubacteria bacterium]
MNPVVHFEIPADDVERAKKFYADNFGWGMEQMGSEYGNYIICRTAEVDPKTRMPREPGRINGGLMKRGTVKTPVIVIAVENTDASVEKVKNSGGKLIGEILDIPNVGRYAYVEDSEGNVIGIMQPMMPQM